MAKVPASKDKSGAVITAYKGFNADWTCRGFQYEVGKTYQHKGTVELCQRGFHACENPFDVWAYYNINDSKFAVVELSGKMAHEDGGDTKIAAAEITIKAELTLPDFIRRAVEWVVDATRGKGDDHGGDAAQIGSSGHAAQIGSSGDAAQIGSSGHAAQIGSSGDAARIGSSGHAARIEASGSGAVVASAGAYARVKGSVGTWASLAEYDRAGKCVGFASGQLERNDIWYVARGGKLEEAA